MPGALGWVSRRWRISPSLWRCRAKCWRSRDSSTRRGACNVVNVAHALADFTLLDSTPLARDLLLTTAAYRDLGLTAQDAEPLFDSAAGISAELDRYLAP